MACFYLVMIYFQLLILFLQLNCERIKVADDDDTCTQMDEARIRFQSNENISVRYQYVECNKCDLIDFFNSTSAANNSKLIDSYYSYRFEVVSLANKTICKEKVYGFRECGDYLFDVTTCEIKLLNSLPFDSNNYIYIALVVVILIIVLFNVIVFLMSRKNKARIRGEQMVELKESTTTETAAAAASKPQRLKCLDTFRGLSLVLMIFVNYGSGGYKQLQHKPWHGITIADFVFPWFLFIMGVSTVISINSLIKKQTKLQIISKIVVRFMKLFAIGIILNSRSGVYLSQLRIFGVLQRIALCYLFVAALEVVSWMKKREIESSTSKYRVYFADLINSWIQWLVVTLVVVLWFLLTYILPVPDCPTGYLGPGGLESHSMFTNCVGGAAGYIDRLIIGSSHLYGRPTCMKIYQTKQAFDPEGLLGTLNSIVLTYFGAQAGRIIIYHKSDVARSVLWTAWSLITFALFAFLTYFDLENGPIPVNKNLWTITYTLLTASSSFLIILLLYFLIDIKKWWNGSPLIQPGMNSIVIYFCHAVFNRTFPSQWLVSNTHVAQLFLNLWGAVFWTAISIYLYFKNIFYNL